MDNEFMTPMRRRVARELVRYFAGHNITCPRCGDLLDAPATVVLTKDSGGTVGMCAKCYAHPVGSFRQGSIEVYDGRDLFAPVGKLKSRTWSYK